MRVLLSKDSKKYVLNYLKKKYHCSSLKNLSHQMNISQNTLDKWFYKNSRYIPESIISPEIINKLEIIDRRENNWGKIKGGKATYKVLLKKYGLEEIKRRQSAGGKKSIMRLRNNPSYQHEIHLNLDDPLFLEFYGILLGDGWLSELHYKEKIIWLVGISGHRILDREFFLYLKENIKKMFCRNAYLKDRPKYNSIELNFSHKMLIKALHETLEFPIGKKIDLVIHRRVYDQGFDKIKHIIRGIFDTDGSFYFDKTPSGNPYPCISIKMKAPRLMVQIEQILLKKGFKPIFQKVGEQQQIKLKGKKQLTKWMNEIGSSNPKHLNKIARVAQLDSAAHS